MGLVRSLLLPPGGVSAVGRSAGRELGRESRRSLLPSGHRLQAPRCLPAIAEGSIDATVTPTAASAATCVADIPAAAAAAATTVTVSAANPAATAGAAAHPASCNPDGNQLGTADLRRFLEQHGIAAAVVPALEGAPPPPGCVEVKSLVYLLGTQPLVLVLPLAARVDERQVAALLHVGRNRVRMAPAGSLIDLCGYSVGNVPPFGHRPRLPVIADSAITAYTSCYAGSGADDAEVLVAVPELLRAAAATVADICVPGSAPRSSSSGGLWSSSPPASVPASVPAPAEEEQAGAQRQEAAATAAAALPLPWQAGQVEVTLEGVVAHRRKIARLLLFANLVPLAAVEQAAAAAMLSPKPGTAAFVRRLWRHPETQQPTEVQLIMGKTLENSLGSEAAEELLRNVRPGRCVRLTGRVQPRPENSRAWTDVCDVVVHSLTLIERPAAPPAVSTSGLPAAQLSAGTTNSQQTPKPAAAGCYQLPVAVQECTVLVDSEAGLVQLEAALFDDAVDCSAVDATESSCASSSSDGTTETSSSSGGVASDEPRGFAPAGRPFRLVVGLDCEWQPFSSRLRELPTPVSLLQLATPDAVYLLDLLALCAEQGNGAGEVLEEGRAGGEGVPAGSRTSSSGSSTSGSSLSTTPEARASSDAGEQHEAALSPLQRRLSALMLRLFGDPSIIKAGFGLSTDLRRLCESYPWLPCFGADGAVPLRSHVDVLLLAHTALGSALPHTRRRISLSSLAEKVLGRGLDKSEQCSSWGARPLRQDQLLYAAADAHALVALHKELVRRRAGLDSPFWVSHFSGSLTDVAAFHPRSRGRSSSRVASSRSSDSSGRRRSSLGARLDRRMAPPAVPGAADGSRGRGLGQTLELDMNVPYLLNTYLGRQLPQGGKAAAVRAAAAHTGRPESGRTPSFPRGCRGLLEFRNGFLLFVNLPEEPAAAADAAGAAGRSYPNQFLWLPPPGATDAAGAPLAASSAASVAAASEAEQQLRTGWRLGLTWWSGRGQGRTADHPVVQRLMAAGTAAAAGAAAAAMPGPPLPLPAEDGSSPPAEATQHKAAVLLFCRAGSNPYVFCGRLQLAAAGGLSAQAAAAAAPSDSGVSLTWELADAAALLGVGKSGSAGDAFLQLL